MTSNRRHYDELWNEIDDEQWLGASSDNVEQWVYGVLMAFMLLITVMAWWEVLS